jgi:hypothetical protein
MGLAGVIAELTEQVEGEPEVGVGVVEPAQLGVGAG